MKNEDGEPEEFGKFIILNGGEITQANIRLNNVSSHYYLR
ncbi:hypothetical protein CRYO30217_01899 [Parvicella tangerina]|uniref:Uncharacterized protein n=1 Tax=Parvicella tangerina TaxID=2829795 RepID=A0A916NC55_9FLAO|nr:hypothetical protein CRYO30217_01899 [Parvicella tangerina]